MFETRKINDHELNLILMRNEDHFLDFKSKNVAPSKLQETFVSFANSEGGDIYVGIEDGRGGPHTVSAFVNKEEANEIIAVLMTKTEPAVEGVIVEFLQLETGGYLLYFAIPKSAQVHKTSAGETYTRINASSRKIKDDKIVELLYAKGTFSYELTHVKELEVSEISNGVHLREYLDKIGSQLEPEAFLKKAGLLATAEGARFPTVASVLLFDDEPQSTLPKRCGVKVYRLRTTDTDYKRSSLSEMATSIDGNLEKLIAKTIKRVQEILADANFFEDGSLTKRAYPTDALKEILVNAVIHRDYSLNDDIHVKIFDNRIEVHSPGKLPGPMTLDNLYDERFSRNPKIVRMLHRLPNPPNHDIGEGLDTAMNEMKRAGLVPPRFNITGNSFIVTLLHQKIASIESVIMEFLEANPHQVITNKTARTLSGQEDINKVKKALQKLRASGYLTLLDEKASAFDYQYVKSDSVKKKDK